jgi:hypothetical protein
MGGSFGAHHPPFPPTRQVDFAAIRAELRVCNGRAGVRSNFLFVSFVSFSVFVSFVLIREFRG